MSVFEAVMLAAGSEEETLELTMYGPIGANLFQDGITPQQIDQALKAQPKAKNVRVRISSPGGSVWDGLAIRAMLAAHPGKKTIEVEGIAASVATVIACAGDKVRMHQGARWMMHEANTQTQGSALEHKRALTRLENINDGAAELYAARCGKSKEEVRALMAAETWMSPAEAVAAGFANEVVPAKKGAAPTMSLDFDLSAWGYQNVPPQLASQTVPQTVVTKTAETVTTVVKEHSMSFARIAMALGLNAEGAEEAAVLSAVQNLRNQVGQRDAVLAQLHALTERSNDDEMLGVVRAMSQAVETVVTLQTELEAANTRLESSERDALVAADAADPKGRRLTPALATLFSNKPVAELKAFLEVAPHVVQMSEQAATGAAAGAGQQSLSATKNASGKLTFEGKTYGEMSALEKHNLCVSDRDTYNAMRDEHRNADV